MNLAEVGRCSDFKWASVKFVFIIRQIDPCCTFEEVFGLLWLRNSIRTWLRFNLEHATKATRWSWLALLLPPWLSWWSDQHSWRYELLDPDFEISWTLLYFCIVLKQNFAYLRTFDCVLARSVLWVRAQKVLISFTLHCGWLRKAYHAWDRSFATQSILLLRFFSYVVTKVDLANAAWLSYALRRWYSKVVCRLWGLITLHAWRLSSIDFH